jgi:hypothetical protein
LELQCRRARFHSIDIVWRVRSRDGKRAEVPDGRPAGKLLAQLILHYEGKRLVEVGLGEKHFAGALGCHQNTRHGKVETARRQQARQRFPAALAFALPDS